MKLHLKLGCGLSTFDFNSYPDLFDKMRQFIEDFEPYQRSMWSENNEGLIEYIVMVNEIIEIDARVAEWIRDKYAAIASQTH